MAFTKTGAPERGVRVADDAKPIDAVMCDETRGEPDEPEEGKEEAEKDAAEQE